MWDQITDPARPEHVDAVVRLALAAEPRCGAVTVVALDGPSGAGKTTLALGVRDRLAEVGLVELVHMDHLYPGWDGLAVGPGLLVEQVLAPLSRGEPATYRLWSWVRDTWHGSRTVAVPRFLVVEGCGSSAGPAAAYASVSVFLVADHDVRMARGIARDGEAYRPNWRRWADQETALFDADATRSRADLVIDTSTL
jgi:uridine kinase